VIHTIHHTHTDVHAGTRSDSENTEVSQANRQPVTRTATVQQHHEQHENASQQKQEQQPQSGPHSYQLRLGVIYIYIYTDKAADADRMLWEVGGWVGGDLGDIVRHY